MNPNKELNKFKNFLLEKESSKNTMEKYLRDVNFFLEQVEEVTHEALRDYKAMLIGRYAPRSVNSMIAAVNQYLNFMDMGQYRIKPLRIQNEVFIEPDKDLDKSEYKKLIETANASGQNIIAMIMETICATGIRISELQYITVQGLKDGQIRVNNKGKVRVIMIPHKLKIKLLYYTKKSGIKAGPIFVTKYGNPVNRSNIWSAMKKIGKAAGIALKKVFPHNLRHLFAKTYYHYTKDIAKLADILGHNNINTTRIYTISTGQEHRKQMEQLGLIL